MSDKDKKNQPEQNKLLSSKSSAERLFRKDSKKIRHINPLGYRVLVRVIKDSNTTDAGLYLPEGSRESMQDSLLAEVIEVASAMDKDTDEETNVSGVPLDAMVLIAKNSGIRVPWDDGLRIIETKDVLATVEEVSVS